MAVSEATVTRGLKSALMACGAYAVKIHGSQFSETGTPDLLMCYGGKFAGIEVKLITNPGNKLRYSEAQVVRLQEIVKAGGAAFGAAKVKSLRNCWDVEIWHKKRLRLTGLTQQELVAELLKE